MDRLKSLLHPLYQGIVGIPKSAQKGLRRAFLEARYAYKNTLGDHCYQGKPVFIVGCGHSGTSLLLSVLGSHESFYDVPEESYLAFKNESEAHSLLRRFRREAIASGCARWVEKTPKHVRRIQTLLRYRPSGRVIVMLRDGRDVACSIRDRTGDFENAVERWVNDNRRAEEHLTDRRVKRIKYEDLVQNFEQTARFVCDFISEKYDKSMKYFHKRDMYYYDWRIAKPSGPEDHERLRNWQVNQPLYDGSGRWKNDMSEAEKIKFKKSAGEMLLKYDYSSGLDW